MNDMNNLTRNEFDYEVVNALIEHITHLLFKFKTSPCETKAILSFIELGREWYFAKDAAKVQLNQMLNEQLDNIPIEDPKSNLYQ